MKKILLTLLSAQLFFTGCSQVESKSAVQETTQEQTEQTTDKIDGQISYKTDSMEKQRYMQAAIDLSIESVKHGGGPFGAVIVKDGEIVAGASNSVTLTCDPTAHAEVNAIRAACQELESFSLEGCELYTSCEPCPMCLSAAYWAGVKCIYYGNSRSDAHDINFSDSFIYDQIPLSPTERTIPSIQMMRDGAITAFDMWREKEDKVVY